MAQTIEQRPQAPRVTSDGAAPPHGGRRRVLAVAIIAALAIGIALVIWRIFFAAHGVPGNIIPLSGRIEGDDSVIASKTSGRIVDVRVREGDGVRAGQIIAVLDDAQVRAREDQARAAVSAAYARARSAQYQIAVLNAQLTQSQLQGAQAGVDARGRVAQAEADLASAQAAVAQQRASYRLAVFSEKMDTQLYRTGDISRHEAQQAVSAAQQAAASLAGEKRRVEAARGALVAARAALANPNIRAAQTAAVTAQITQQRAVVTSSIQEARQAQAQLAEAEANRADLILRAPFTGTIITRAAEPGEVVPAGAPIVTLLDLHAVYLRGFIPEEQIGKIRVGQPARVYLDSNPNVPVEAYVMRIDPQATFTPENTYFREDRVKQVFGVKLRITTPGGYAKPGMPADGEILVRGRWTSNGRVS